MAGAPSSTTTIFNTPSTSSATFFDMAVSLPPTAPQPVTTTTTTVPAATSSASGSGTKSEQKFERALQFLDHLISLEYTVDRPYVCFAPVSVFGILRDIQRTSLGIPVVEISNSLGDDFLESLQRIHAPESAYYSATTDKPQMIELSNSIAEYIGNSAKMMCFDVSRIKPSTNLMNTLKEMKVSVLGVNSINTMEYSVEKLLGTTNVRNLMRKYEWAPPPIFASGSAFVFRSDIQWSPLAELAESSPTVSTSGTADLSLSYRLNPYFYTLYGERISLSQSEVVYTNSKQLYMQFNLRMKSSIPLTSPTLSSSSSLEQKQTLITSARMEAIICRVARIPEQDGVTIDCALIRPHIKNMVPSEIRNLYSGFLKRIEDSFPTIMNKLISHEDTMFCKRLVMPRINFNYSLSERTVGNYFYAKCGIRSIFSRLWLSDNASEDALKKEQLALSGGYLGTYGSNFHFSESSFPHVSQCTFPPRANQKVDTDPFSNEHHGTYENDVIFNTPYIMVIYLHTKPTKSTTTTAKLPNSVVPLFMAFVTRPGSLLSAAFVSSNINENKF